MCLIEKINLSLFNIYLEWSGQIKYIKLLTPLATVAFALKPYPSLASQADRVWFCDPKAKPEMFVWFCIISPWRPSPNDSI